MLLMRFIPHFQPDSVLLLKDEQKKGKRTATYYFCNQRIRNQAGSVRVT